MLQYGRLHRKNNESALGLRSRLRTKAAECQYKEYDKLLTEQFISGLNDDGRIDEILKDDDIEDATRKLEFLWVCVG